MLKYQWLKLGFKTETGYKPCIMKSAHNDSVFCLRQCFRDPVPDLAVEVGTDLVLIVVFITFSAVLLLSRPHPLFIQTLSLPILLFSPETPGSKLVSAWKNEGDGTRERQSEKKKKREGWRMRTYKTKKSWTTRRGERTRNQAQKEKQGWRRPEEGEQIITGVPMFSKPFFYLPFLWARKKRERAERGKMRRGRLTSRQL